MDQVTLGFQERTETRKTAAKRLRTSGRIPAVVYGQGAPASISVDSHEFSMRFASFGENTVIRLQNGKTSYDVLVKDYQDNLLTNQIQHIDFYHVSATKTLHANIPVHISGTAVGVRNGGLLEHLVHEIEVECLAKDLPHSFTVDVTSLDIGSSFHLRELTAPQGVKILTHEDTVLAHVISTKNLNVEAAPVVEAAPEAEAAPAAAAKPAPGAGAPKAPEKKA